jgi:hypothetical protein
VLVQQRRVLAARERLAAGEHLVEQAAQRVDVGTPVDATRGEPLGGHVVGRAHRGPGDGEAGGRRAVAGDAEVDEVHRVGRAARVLGQQHVGGLDVAVDQVRLVRGVERRGELREDAHRPPRLERALTGEDLAEVLAVDEAHVDEEPAVDLAEPVDRDDVLLAQARGDPGLALEAGAVVRIGRQRLQQQLDRTTRSWTVS